MLQRTPEWFAIRVGKVTASRMVDVMASLADPKKEATSRRNYRRELALERFTGMSQESGYMSFAMQQGIEKEAEARDAYAFAKGVDIEEVGFVPHPSIENAGASPDGLIGKDGLIEIKCPEANAMFEMLTRAPLDVRYIYQAQWQLACTRRQWVDIAFFRPGCPLEIVRLDWDSLRIDELERAVCKFLAEVDADYQQLMRIHQR